MENRSRVVKRGQKIRLNLVHPIYKTVSKLRISGKSTYKESYEKLVKEIRLIKWLNLEAIISVEEYLTAKGTVAKSRSIIFDKYTGKHYATYHPVEEILSFLEGGKNNSVGFNTQRNGNHI